MPPCLPSSTPTYSGLVRSSCEAGISTRSVPVLFPHQWQELVEGAGLVVVWLMQRSGLPPLSGVTRITTSLWESAGKSKW